MFLIKHNSLCKLLCFCVCCVWFANWLHIKWRFKASNLRKM